MNYVGAIDPLSAMTQPLWREGIEIVLLYTQETHKFTAVLHMERCIHETNKTSTATHLFDCPVSLPNLLGLARPGETDGLMSLNN